MFWFPIFEGRQAGQGIIIRKKKFWGKEVRKDLENACQTIYMIALQNAGYNMWWSEKRSSERRRKSLSKMSKPTNQLIGFTWNSVAMDSNALDQRRKRNMWMSSSFGIRTCNYRAVAQRMLRKLNKLVLT